MVYLLPGLSACRVPTARLSVAVLEADGRHGEPVLFVHANVSSSLFWQETVLALPPRYRPLAVDLRGFGDTDPEPIDATRGLRDHSDDLLALLDALGLESVHVVGWSMGGGVALQLLRDAPSRLLSTTLVAPMSPFGLGGTRDVHGTLTYPDGAGSGGGVVNAEVVRRLAEGDRSSDDQLSPRQVMLTTYFAGGHVPRLVDTFVESMLATRIGADFFPGDAVPSPHWPAVAPGTRGVLNSMAPTHLHLHDLHTVNPKPPILWVRGSADIAVSDTSMYDLAYLGSLGAVPDWPGAAECPPQPMIAQTRAVLDRYAAAGGRYREVVSDGAGHSPHIERPEQFRAALEEHLATA